MVSTEVYCTAEEIRDEFSGTNTDDDAKLTAIATAVSRMIDGFMGYPETGFVASDTATAREFTTEPKSYVWTPPCVEVTSVAMKESVTQNTYDVNLAVGTDVRGFRGDPESPMVEYSRVPYHGIILLAGAKRRRFTDGRFTGTARGFPVHPDDTTTVTYLPTVQIMAKWGYAVTVPEPIKRAAIMQSTRLYKRGEGAMADMLLSGDFNMQRYVSMLDPDVKVMLKFSRLGNPAVKFGGRSG